MDTSLFSVLALTLAFALMALIAFTRCRALFPPFFNTTSPKSARQATLAHVEKRFALKAGPPTDFYHDIDSLPDFDWTQTSPQRLRPFKPKSHLTMGAITSSVTSKHVLVPIGTSAISCSLNDYHTPLLPH